MSELTRGNKSEVRTEVGRAPFKRGFSPLVPAISLSDGDTVLILKFFELLAELENGQFDDAYRNQG